MISQLFFLDDLDIMLIPLDEMTQNNSKLLDFLTNFRPVSKVPLYFIPLRYSSVGMLWECCRITKSITTGKVAKYGSLSGPYFPELD